MIDIDIDNNNLFENNYKIDLSFNNESYHFNFTETLNNYDKHYKLIFIYDNISYIGGTDILSKIIEIFNWNLIVHEIDEIEKQLIKEKEIIDEVDFQIKGASNIMIKFSISPEIALLCF